MRLDAVRFGKQLAAVAVAICTCGSAQAGDSMDEFAWSVRPVIVFGASETDQMMTEQLTALTAEQDALRERDMVVISIWPDRTEVDGQMSVLSSSGLRERYSVSQGTFAVLLVGKDTGVKHRATAPIHPDVLFGKVDRMPMRQREMRTRSGD